MHLKLYILLGFNSSSRVGLGFGYCDMVSFTAPKAWRPTFCLRFRLYCIIPQPIFWLSKPLHLRQSLLSGLVLRRVREEPEFGKVYHNCGGSGCYPQCGVLSIIDAELDTVSLVTAFSKTIQKPFNNPQKNSFNLRRLPSKTIFLKSCRSPVNFSSYVTII